MKRRVLIFTIVIILVVLGSILYMNKKEKTLKYYINLQDYTIPGYEYILEFDSKGKYKIDVTSFSSTLDVQNQTYSYNGTFNQKELNYILNIIEYINKRNNLKKDNYSFYVDSSTNLLDTDNSVLIEMLSAIYDISKGDLVMKDTTWREFGDEYLEKIYKNL
jgi:hypothetical protein